MIRMPTNDEIIEKYLHNNFGRTASEQALNEARADENSKIEDNARRGDFTQGMFSALKECHDIAVTSRERQRIKKIIEEAIK